ncbi:hypothetical protein [Leucobacter luti]|uniref:hypothetical protein n=1 Tax=Leucobacter luti TaxID=340320 RepID=UPI001C689132|nr:hypothetical protein [Leucobacter luti]QYM75419.1 hypothetical protein K1X41_12385 [Leucobacter luti]
MTRESPLQRALHIAGIIGAIVLIVVVIWLDIATGVWQDLVILSGLAAGLVSFLLTVLVIDRMVARSNARRWAPVTRLALTEILHDVADDDESEIAKGIIVARTIPRLDSTLPQEAWPAELHALRDLVVAERAALADALSRWVEFLAASADTTDILQHVAGIGLQLDRVRDGALEVEVTPSAATYAALDTEIATCNQHFADLTAELQERLQESIPGRKGRAHRR